MTLKTLDNSLELLQYFTKENPAWGVRELAKEMNTSHTIVYRILTTFEQHGFLVQDEQTKKYKLGLKFLEYGLLIQENLKIHELISPVMKKITEETGESVFLTWLDGLECICLTVEESSHRIKYAVTPGSRTPLYAGASNKIIMAFLPRDKQKLIIEKGLVPRTDRTITDAELLLEDLDKIKSQGWAYSVGEYSEEVVGIAMPLFDNRHQVIASLTVAGPTYRIPEENVDSILGVLSKGCEQIQEYLRHLNLGTDQYQRFVK